MSAVTAQVFLAEYLNTEYEPDCDYVDGILEDRNVGKKRHSRVQGSLYAKLLARQKEHGCDVLLEQRVQVSASRIRIPDICVASPNNDEVIQEPSSLWVEILSLDRWSRVQPRLDDALRFGVRTIWVIDPYSKEAWITTSEHGTVPVEDGILRCTDPALELTFAEILPED